jgi:hypothetical protein
MATPTKMNKKHTQLGKLAWINAKWREKENDKIPDFVSPIFWQKTVAVVCSFVKEQRKATSCCCSITVFRNLITYILFSHYCKTKMKKELFHI